MKHANLLGASGRLREAISATRPDLSKEDLIAIFGSEFDLQATAARKILNQDHIPRANTRKAISDFAGISESFWMFGYDKFCEDRTVELFSQSVEAVLNCFRRLALNVDDYPAGLITHLANSAYREAAESGNTIDEAFVEQSVQWIARITNNPTASG